MASTSGVALTAGAVIALSRLKAGSKLSQQKNRTKVLWVGTDESLHHLTFANLHNVDAIKEMKGPTGFATFGLTPKGRRLAG